MICNSPQELLAEIRRYMYVNNIQDKELAVMMGKSPQSVSQFFSTGNPKLSTLFDMCKALNLDIDIHFIDKNSDTN